MTAFILNPEDIRDISPLLLDEAGDLKIVSSTVLAATTREERAMFGVRHALYGLPTVELVEHLRTLIAGRSAIEIGAGSGILARALGIPATDNRQQEWPSVQEYYAALRQPTIRYGDHVEALDAQAAVAKYKPQVVIASWVTHRYDPARHDAGGNQDGVDEVALLEHCEEYIFIGNEKVHAAKPLWAVPHTKERLPFVFSRAANGSADFVARWRGKLAK